MVIVAPGWIFINSNSKINDDHSRAGEGWGGMGKQCSGAMSGGVWSRCAQIGGRAESAASSGSNYGSIDNMSIASYIKSPNNGMVTRSRIIGKFTKHGS